MPAQVRVAVTDFVAAYTTQEGYQVLSPATSLMEPQQLTSADFSAVAKLGNSLLQNLNIDPEKLGVVVGSSKGDLASLPDWGQSQTLNWVPDFVLSHYPEAAGPKLSPNAACATGAQALTLGAQLIQDGYAEAVLCGAIEFPQHPLVIAGYRNMGALSKAGIMRPFDKRRDGFLANSGAGFLLLEAENHALARGAQIEGFSSGWSMKCDPTHITAMCPSGDWVARAIEDALRRAGGPPVGYINAHGTATKINDIIESRAIRQVFGHSVPVSATKPVTGHLLGAAGTVEAIISLLALRDGTLPPTLNYQEPDEELDLDYISGQPRQSNIEAALSLNYGFGGHISALIFEKAK